MAAKKKAPAKAQQAPAKKAPAKKAPTKTKLEAQARAEARTPSEERYGTGDQRRPPMMHELSPQSQAAVHEGFTEAMSNWKSREQVMVDKGLKSALSQPVVDRLTDETVDIPTAAGNVARKWESMMSEGDRGEFPSLGWYFGHNRRSGRSAERFGVDKGKLIDASASMSPQNDPDSEHRAASAMADAVGNRRRVTDTRTGKQRQLSAMTPDEMQETTESKNARNVSGAKDFDLAGFRSAGTNRREGFRTLAEPGYNAVDHMESGKVPYYADLTKASEPDAQVHHEFDMRLSDQVEARRVRQGREQDVAAGRTGSETLRGVMDRVDVYGLMGKDAQEDDPIHDHEVLGKRGLAVADSWMTAIASGQDILDNEQSVSPAKMGASQTKSMTASPADTTFRKDSEVDGGKRLTAGAAYNIGATDVLQRAALLAREPESQTTIPPSMVQEGTWVHTRNQVAQSALDSNTKNRGAAATRVSKLTGGRLEGEKEFRSAEGGRQVSSIGTPGAFHRGSDNPLDTDSVTLVPHSGTTRSGAAGSGAPQPLMERFHARAASTGPVSDMDKRRAIREALATHTQERTARGITQPPDGGLRGRP